MSDALFLLPRDRFEERPRDVPPALKKMVAGLTNDVAYVRKLLAD